MSSDDGVSYSEIDSAFVRDKTNLHEYTTQTSNFAPADIGSTFLFKVEAINIAGTLLSTSLAVVLADLPGTPAAGPVSD